VADAVFLYIIRVGSGLDLGVGLAASELLIADCR